MAPLDPEQSSVASHWAIKGLEEGFGYLVTLVIGWVASRAFVGKRLTAIETTVAAQPGQIRDAVEGEMTAMEERIMKRITKIAIEQQAVTQEVFGVHGQGGVSRRLDDLSRDVQTLRQSNARIEANIKTLIERKS